MKIDIDYIAKKAGCSPATVSRVLNKSKPVSDVLTKRVIDAVDEYRYKPNGFARGLAMKHSYVLGLVISKNLNQFHSRLIGLLASCAADEGYGLSLMTAETSAESRIKALEIFQAQKVDGVLCAFEADEEERQRVRALIDIPVIYANENFLGISPKSENYNAAKDAGEYLAKLGHRKIAALFPPDLRPESMISARRRGFLAALRYWECSREPAYMINEVWNMEQATNAIEKLMNLSKPPTAIFCYSDEVAIGAMITLMHKGIRIPEDISVLGFDGLSMAAEITPALTTIEQNLEFQALGIIKQLIALSKNTPLDETGLEMQPLYRLVIRDSCAPIQV